MKSLAEISTLVKVGTSMVEEAKKSESLMKAKAELKDDINSIKNSEIPKKVILDLVQRHRVRTEAIKAMLNSDEAQFIKMAAKESDKVKKITGNLENIEDLIPEKLKLEYINYKHWCLNWFYISKMGLSAPLPVVKGMLKYGWIYDLLKINSMTNMYLEGRSGANVEQVNRQISYIVKETCEMLQFGLSNPDKVILMENMVPKEILVAMGLRSLVVETPGAILPKLDQFTGLRYLDAAEDKGLAGDTCGLPRFTTGVSLLDEVPDGRCIVTSNLPCDGGLASYETIQERLGGIPTYRLNVPYNFREDKSQEEFAEDLKGLIKFLEENADGKMDWDKLREVCTNYNELAEAEIERWELIKLKNTPISNDALWFPHYWNLNVSSGTKETTKHHKKLLELAKKAKGKGQAAFPNMKYRIVMWNPPPSGYGHLWNWLERCWGIACVMDLETCGNMEFIDISTPETMLKGLGRRYMWGTMAKHTRGPADNMIGDFVTSIKEFKADFVMYPAHIGCKNSMSMEVMLKEECKKLNVPFCTFKYELLDNRVASRQEIRNQISKFMTDIMHAKPVDESLLIINDGEEDHW